MSDARNERGRLILITPSSHEGGFGPWPARLVVWLTAVGFVLVDAGIVFVAIMTCLNLAL